MRYELLVALRYLRARPSQSFISLITYLSMAGVALGVCALIVVLSVMSGFQAELKNKILGQSAHVLVFNASGGIDDPAKVEKAALADPEVKAAAPFVYGQVMMVAQGGAGGAVLQGLAIPKGLEVLDVEANMIDGSAASLAQRGPKGLPRVIVGSALARQMGLYPGAVVNLINPLGADSPVGRVPVSEPFEVAGLFESGMHQYDASVCYTSLEAAQAVMGMDGMVTGVEMTLHDIYAARQVAQRLTQKLGPLYYARDWIGMNHNLFSALELEKTAMFIILTLIVLVAAFGIVSSLVMLVIEKTRDIGVLKAMGATHRGVGRIFILEGLIIGSAGTLLGVAGGLGLCALLRRYKFIELPKDIYTMNSLPVLVEPWVVVLVAACAMAICLAATIYPARAAGRLDPVRALRYE